MRTLLLYSALITFCSCQKKASTTDVNISERADSVAIQTLPDTVDAAQPHADVDVAAFGLVLTSNALQTINKATGSTSEVAFGMKEDQMIKLVSSILMQPPASVGINSECGAGPLKMASWDNGLTLAFDQKNGVDWHFVGWYHSKPRSNAKSKILTTMAGVGIGTTRSDFESAYVIKVEKTTLGYEFSTASGLYGILDGANADAVITDMWSGTSCNFR